MVPTVITIWNKAKLFEIINPAHKEEACKSILYILIYIF